MRLQDLYQCNQITLNAASQLQQAETTRAADFAKPAASSLTAANRTALLNEIRSMKAQIDYFRQKLGLHYPCVRESARNRRHADCSEGAIPRDGNSGISGRIDLEGPCPSLRRRRPIPPRPALPRLLRRLVADRPPLPLAHRPCQRRLPPLHRTSAPVLSPGTPCLNSMELWSVRVMSAHTEDMSIRSTSPGAERWYR
jgi:hypothetical protein